MESLIGYSGSITVLNVSPYPEFNFFFTLSLVWGMVSFIVASVADVIGRE